MRSTAEPTVVAASLVFVVQSPWAGLFVPNATVLPGTVDAEGVVISWLLEQANSKMDHDLVTRCGRNLCAYSAGLSL